MKFRDIYGRQLQYGDTVMEVSTHNIGVIARSETDDRPVFYLLKRFNWKYLNFETIYHKSAAACYESDFIPKHTKLYWILHGWRLTNIELIQHAERNRRVKKL